MGHRHSSNCAAAAASFYLPAATRTGTTELEPCSMSPAIDSNYSTDKKCLTRVKTMEDAESQFVRREKETSHIISMLSSNDDCQELEGTIDWDGQYSELAKEAKSILTKCNGFPLAILTIGGVLAKRPKTLVEWRKLNEYIVAELETNPERETIRSIVVKCYDCLPYDIKSLIQRFVESIGSMKGIDSCKFNDLIHEMSTSKSMEENLVLRLEEGCGMKTTQGKTRHLSVISDKWNGGRTEYENIVNPCTVRSLTVFGKWRPFFISEKMRMLRVLDLEGTSGLNDHDLEHIGKLLHLKFYTSSSQVSLRSCSDIWRLDTRGVVVPSGINKLNVLHTLGTINIGQGKAVLQGLRRLIRLRKLGVVVGEPGLAGCLESDDVLKYSPPEKLRSLKLDGNLVELPAWINGLQSLAKLSLSGSRISDPKAAMQVLGKLPNLTMLRLLNKAFESEKLHLTFDGDGGPLFQRLQLLHLNRVDGLQEVEFKQGEMPMLQVLLLRGVHGTTTLLSGLSSLPRLKQLLLEGDYSEGFLQGLRQQLDSNPNRPVLKMD
ncbi:hypothetical protein U9M48_038036 [Paspalum notatum var. saurae]|uniref:Disease resistance R13L4/SHOC-2-like LRR domain-containing protein n=1 Tax=Paspalum notatum var. saurae TaxID=547442 RepID=A0AAQ3UKI6_PASNO